ncbi:hypothetical protein D039_0011A, partial [Vibrio parahaemolyticus EKP-028]
MIAPVISTSA